MHYFLPFFYNIVDLTCDENETAAGGTSNSMHSNASKTKRKRGSVDDVITEGNGGVIKKGGDGSVDTQGGAFNLKCSSVDDVITEGNGGVIKKGGDGSVDTQGGSFNLKRDTTDAGSSTDAASSGKKKRGNTQKKNVVDYNKALAIQKNVYAQVPRQGGAPKYKYLTAKDIDDSEKAHAIVLDKGCNRMEHGVSLLIAKIMEYHNDGRDKADSNQKLQEMAVEVGEEFFYPDFFQDKEEAKEFLGRGKPQNAKAIDMFWDSLEEGMDIKRVSARR